MYGKFSLFEAHGMGKIDIYTSDSGLEQLGKRRRNFCSMTLF